MNKFKNILVLYDIDQGRAALKCSIRMAKKSGARITIGRVLEEIPNAKVSSGVITELWNTVLQESHRELELLAKELSAEGLESDFRLVTGTPFIEVIREVLRNGYDLVIKNSEGKGGLRGVFLGSNDWHLLRKCPCPVWIVKPSHHQKFSRIMAAVDPDPLDKERDALNTKIIEVAAAISRMERGTLYIVHAWQAIAENLLRVRGQGFEVDVETYINDIHAQHRKNMKELIDKSSLGDIDYEVHMLKGGAWDIIPALQKEKKSDLLVTGTVARTGLPGLFIGNTAEKLLNKTKCSILAIKPEGFRTPVSL